jgi:two-component system sensor histidine kinase TtrS
LIVAIPDQFSYRIIRFLALLLILFSLFHSTLADAQEKREFSIGIFNQSSNTAFKDSGWVKTFDLLNQHPNLEFKPVFLDLDQLHSQLEDDELDFVITDAINYLVMEKNYGVLRLATRNTQYQNEIVSSEAISVYALNSNADITTLQDLRDRKAGVLESNAAMSRQFLDKFLSNHGLIESKNIELLLMDKPKLILQWLKNGIIDAMIVRSGFIEQFFDASELEKLRLVNPRRSWHAPYLHSSVMIPDWTLAKAWFIDDSLSKLMTATLLSHNPKVNTDSQYFIPQYSWGIAQNYHALNELFEFPEETELEQPQDKSFFTTREQYWISFAVFCFLLIILILYLRSSRDLNNRLKASKESLEQEIKERQHAQEQTLNHQAELAHVARLSTMGEMASGLAHELNQPLSAIHTYVQGCIRRINMGNNDSEAIINALQLTAQQAHRAGGIIRRLRSFVRKGESHKTYTEINHIVNEVTSFLDTQLKNKKVSLSVELEDELPPVLADIIQIEQVLINLLKNGIESMSDMDEPQIKVLTRRFNSNLVELCVIDSGHGISEDKLKRIFNPFFTTKSSGMGMGLSISSSIIEAHEGKLYAENNPDKGARFCFTLPITEEHLGKNNNE